MNDIKVQKADLLNKLKTNREGHRKIFEEALEGYRKEMEKELTLRLAEIREGKKIVRLTAMQVPEDHTIDYDRVIEMVQMAIDDTIFLSEHDVAMYIMDDWQWTRNFLVSNSAYSATATRTLASKSYR